MSLKDKLHILVVDDMSTSRGLITQALDEIGIVNYRTENDGAQAWRSLAAKPVHLILSDFNMPGMDGLQLLEGIRSNKATARTGFILITGRADPDTINRGVKLGMNNFIKKPFETAQLKACIEKVVGPL
ncbi:response regulator [Shimia sp.]|jgi:two-component system chemotaxis response regulator CheY|uniref:response regulator n=1 Tax=unclassified Shimia TaxID=2630038 RepID=UPI0019DA7795|nr:response regulator [Shimia sp.]MBE1290871.1 response regulator [Paracoccaceae bacterium]MBO6898417.1 response regulator [Shimia sp.]MCH2068611.1 response regulator [Shimia sp.]